MRVVNNAEVGDTDEFTKAAGLNLLELPEYSWEQTFDLHLPGTR